jgi:hypothetical protein
MTTRITHLARLLLLASALLTAAAPMPATAAKAADSPITTDAMRALWWGDFDALEKQNALLKQPGHIASDGSSDLEMFRIGVGRVLEENVDNREPYLQELDKLTLQWAADHPASALAHILHAKALVAHGWSYRGGGYAKDVPPQAWEDFHAYLRRAAEYLISHADVALTDSYAHATLLVIGKGLNWDNKQMAAIAQDGLKRNPEDINLYFESILTLLPKWGGDARALDKYIRQVAEQTKGIYGMGMYSRLYSYAAENEYGHALFDNSLADWATLRQGYQDMHARYPSNSRRNRYAYMACLAKDKNTLNALLDELGANIDASLWGPNPQRSLEGCQRWAKQG